MAFALFVFQYRLETFTEGRKTKKKKKPYKGGPVDGPENGTPPPPWAIPCQPKCLFKDEKVKIEVPHTAKVKVTTPFGFFSASFHPVFLEQIIPFP